MSKFVAWQVVSLIKNEQQSQNLLLKVDLRSTFRNNFFQPATNVFVAYQVEHARWKTGNMDENLQRNNVARQVLGFLYLVFRRLKRAFSYKGAFKWNGLGNNLMDERNLDSVKSALTLSKLLQTWGSCNIYFAVVRLTFVALDHKILSFYYFFRSLSNYLKNHIIVTFSSIDLVSIKASFCNLLCKLLTREHFKEVIPLIKLWLID